MDPDTVDTQIAEVVAEILAELFEDDWDSQIAEVEKELVEA